MQWQTDPTGQIWRIGPRGWARRSATAHKRGRVDAEPDMAGQVHLDILSGGGGTNQAGSPVHDAVVRE